MGPASSSGRGPSAALMTWREWPQGPHADRSSASRAPGHDERQDWLPRARVRAAPPTSFLQQRAGAPDHVSSPPPRPPSLAGRWARGPWPYRRLCEVCRPPSPSHRRGCRAHRAARGIDGFAGQRSIWFMPGPTVSPSSTRRSTRHGMIALTHPGCSASSPPAPDVGVAGLRLSDDATRVHAETRGGRPRWCCRPRGAHGDDARRSVLALVCACP